MGDDRMFSVLIEDLIGGTDVPQRIPNEISHAVDALISDPRLEDVRRGGGRVVWTQPDKGSDWWARLYDQQDILLIPGKGSSPTDALLDAAERLKRSEEQSRGQG